MRDRKSTLKCYMTLHIAERALQTVKQTYKCRYKRTKNSAGIDEGIAMGEVTIQQKSLQVDSNARKS